uniref:Uncharacterized protein n=1 Tax=Tetraselmis sp. GSL018 TaxID=582737 RepID=A0A061R3Q6_9CHLO
MSTTETERIEVIRLFERQRGLPRSKGEYSEQQYARKDRIDRSTLPRRRQQRKNRTVSYSKSKKFVSKC